MRLKILDKELFLYRFIVAGSCRLVVVSCNQASVQLTSLSASASVWLPDGSVVLQLAAKSKSEIKSRKESEIFFFIGLPRQCLSLVFVIVGYG